MCTYVLDIWRVGTQLAIRHTTAIQKCPLCRLNCIHVCWQTHQLIVLRQAKANHINWKSTAGSSLQKVTWWTSRSPRTRMLTRMLIDKNNTCHIFWTPVWDTPIGHTDLPLLRHTLAGYSNLTHLLGTFVGNSDLTRLFGIFVGRSYLTLLRDGPLTWHSCRTLLLDTFSLDTFVGRFCKTLL